jgi:hypothetical protein
MTDISELRFLVLDAYRALAVLFPVALGLKLIYLYVMGEIAAVAVFGVLACAASLIPAVVRLGRTLEGH